mmetsp:Transcript_2929/g.3091  ORF Transcript_2929/g.3091 Transcript_2929/m.3091 type:complete len:105 (-) Transcript_2929:186-500(-)
MALSNVKDLLGCTMRIRVQDGRLIEGIFQCMDREMNFVLNGATEYHNMTEDNFTDMPSEYRKLGMAMIPGKFILRCSVLKQCISEFELDPVSKDLSHNLKQTII